MTNLSLDTLTLGSGSHDTREDGLCVMEAVAWLAGEEHTDQPQCASPVITKFCQNLNDTWDDRRRQDLIPYMKLIVDTRDGLDGQRALMCADWLFRTYTPTWLRLAGLDDEAELIESQGPFTDWSMLDAVTASLRVASEKAAAAWDAAWDAARDAARAAASEALAPTVTELQDSALELLARMCDLQTDREPITRKEGSDPMTALGLEGPGRGHGRQDHPRPTQCRFTDSVRPVLVDSDWWHALIMPVRI